MSAYVCALVDGEGRLREIVREASSEKEIAADFSKGELCLVSVRKKRADRPERRRGRGPRCVRETTIMLASLLDSGLALKSALTIAAEIAKNGSPERRLLEGLLESIRRGDSLSKALEAYGRDFSSFYRGMVGIGERIGSVESVLPRLAAYLTDRETLREKTIGALVYPSMVLSLAVLGVVAVVFLLGPQLLALFSGLGAAAAERVQGELSAMRAAACLSGIVAVTIALCVVVFLNLRKRGGELATRVDGFVLRFPALGSFLSAYETLNFTYAMEILVGGGVTVEAGLAEAAKVIGNGAYRRAISRCRDELLAGRELSVAMAGRRELPPRLARWMAIGESSGNAETAFGQLRRHYDGELARITSRFAALVEPAAILFVGIVMAVLVSAFVVPLFSLYGAML